VAGVLVMAHAARQAVAVALSDHELAVLDFERSWWTEDGVKDVLIEQRLELTSARYYQLLNELLDRADALEHDPLLVKRLRRLRDRKRRARLDAASSADRPGGHW
jgi:uncharacterized protein DUF3263